MSIPILSLVREIVYKTCPLVWIVRLSGGRTRRVVKYRRGVEVWEYVNGMKRLPGQCLSSDDPGDPRP